MNGKRELSLLFVGLFFSLGIFAHFKQARRQKLFYTFSKDVQCQRSEKKTKKKRTNIVRMEIQENGNKKEKPIRTNANRVKLPMYHPWGCACVGVLIIFAGLYHLFTVWSTFLSQLHKNQLQIEQKKSHNVKCISIFFYTFPLNDWQIVRVWL